MDRAIALFLGLALASAGLGVAAVYLLAGLGWALLAGAAFLALAAWFVRGGLKADG